MCGGEGLGGEGVIKKEAAKFQYWLICTGTIEIVVVVVVCYFHNLFIKLKLLQVFNSIYG